VTSTINDPNNPPGASASAAVGPIGRGDGGPAMPQPRRRRRASKRLWLVFAVLLAAFVFLLVQGLGSALNYFDTVNQAFAHRSTLGTRTFNLEGDVVPGSIHATAVGTNFSIAQGSHTVAVTDTGSPPQLFQANIAVVVVGHFTSVVSHNFVSHQILVKHSENYCAAHPNRVKKTSAARSLC
jgi:cytochrome c-type biogenesis protein CcmE